jgi:urease accessory protein UreF
MIVTDKQLALSDAAEWLGNWHPLAEQLGSADGLVGITALAARLDLPPVRDLASLRAFLKEYHERILLPHELPAIESAHGHAIRTEVRELIALDQQLIAQPALGNFSAASRRVGQAQIQKLRPLRDQRVVQRYLNAVEAGQAHGWHTLVYGLSLAVYSLPLRQGLLGYAHQMTRSFIYIAARLLRLSEHQCRELFNEFAAGLAAGVERLVQKNWTLQAS